MPDTRDEADQFSQSDGLDTSGLPGSVNLTNLAAMLDVPLKITVELGRAELPLAEVLALKPGSVVELDRFPGEPLDLYANGRLVARGEIIVLNDIFGFRITDILLAQVEGGSN
jgi:flagellar motor switch protein FliN/FliY